MREKQLSKRLQAVADMVTPGLRVADVGCDHAYVSIYLTERGIARECFALDVRTGPLLRAERNIAAHQLSGRIHTRLGSGLEPIQPGEIDAVLMAGMGGILVRDLLEESRELSHSLQEWVLQPQSDVDLVRRYIRESGFCIVEENFIREDGKYYPMFRAVPGYRAERDCQAETGCLLETGCLTEVSDRFGELLLHQRHPVLKEYLEERRLHYEQVLRQMRGNHLELSENREKRQKAESETQKKELLEERLRKMEQEAEYVRAALEYYE